METDTDTIQPQPQPLPPPETIERGRTGSALQDYCEAALKAWGGPAAFGSELRRRYDAPTTNANAKVRILDMMMEFLKLQHSLIPQEQTALSDLTPEELDDELRHILAEGALRDRELDLFEELEEEAKKTPESDADLDDVHQRHPVAGSADFGAAPADVKHGRRRP